MVSAVIGSGLQTYVGISGHVKNELASSLCRLWTGLQMSHVYEGSLSALEFSNIPRQDDVIARKSTAGHAWGVVFTARKSSLD